LLAGLLHAAVLLLDQRVQRFEVLGLGRSHREQELRHRVFLEVLVDELDEGSLPLERLGAQLFHLLEQFLALGVRDQLLQLGHVGLVDLVVLFDVGQLALDLSVVGHHQDAQHAARHLVEVGLHVVGHHGARISVLRERSHFSAEALDAHQRQAGQQYEQGDDQAEADGQALSDADVADVHASVCRGRPRG